MEIFSKSTLPAPLLTIPRQPAGEDLSFLKPGQLYSAEVVRSTDSGEIGLRINERLLKAVSDLQLAQGSRITVKVEMKEGQLALRLIAPQKEVAPPIQQALRKEAPAPIQQALRKETTPPIQQALRQVLPKQQPLQPFFTQLARIVMQPHDAKTVQANTRFPAGTEQPAGKPAAPTVTTPPVPGSPPSSPKQVSAEATAARSILNTIQASPPPASGKTAALTIDIESLPPLPPKVREAVLNLFKQLPNNDKLATAEGVKQAVNNSGLFFESRLLQGADSSTMQGDVKTLLFRLASLLRQALQSLPQAPRPPDTPQGDGKTTAQQPTGRGKVPAQSSAVARQAETTALIQLLGRQTESALARIQMNQLTTINSQQQGDEPTLTMELPLFNGKESEVVELKIRREARHNGGETETCWSVTLKLDNEEYGPVRAVVSLIGKKVSTTFWCEQPETQQHFHKHLHELRSQMENQGLELGRTQAFAGTPPEPDGPDTPPSNENLISTRA